MTISLMMSGAFSFTNTWSFTSLALLDSFLSDHVLNLGLSPQSDMTGEQITMSFDMKAKGPGDYAFDYVLASVPEPPAWAVFLPAALFWLWRRRHAVVGRT